MTNTNRQSRIVENTESTVFSQAYSSTSTFNFDEAIDVSKYVYIKVSMSGVSWGGSSGGTAYYQLPGQDEALLGSTHVVSNSSYVRYEVAMNINCVDKLGLMANNIQTIRVKGSGNGHVLDTSGHVAKLSVKITGIKDYWE